MGGEMHDVGSPRKEKLETGSLPSKIFLSSSREKILGYGKKDNRSLL